jgi:DNA-binding CsgD family transcriptional regulator
LALTVVEAEQAAYDLLATPTGREVVAAAQIAPSPLSWAIYSQFGKTQRLDTVELASLQHKSEGLTHAAIAHRTGESERSVRRYLASTQSKLCAHNLTSTVRRGLEYGLLTPLRQSARAKGELGVDSFLALALASRGWTVRQIGERFAGTMPTAKAHRLIALRVLGEREITAAVSVAWGLGALLSDLFLRNDFAERGLPSRYRP